MSWSEIHSIANNQGGATELAKETVSAIGKISATCTGLGDIFSRGKFRNSILTREVRTVKIC